MSFELRAIQQKFLDKKNGAEFAGKRHASSLLF